MAISVVQRASAASAGTTTIKPALTTSNTAGNAIIVIGIAGTTTATDLNSLPTDTQGNTYAVVTTINATAFGNGLLIRVWANYNIAAHTGTNTVTIPNANNDAAGFAWEVAGLATSAAFDKSSSADQTSATALDSGATATTTYANELLLGVFADDNSTSLGFTLGSGYSNAQQNGATTGYGTTEEQIVSTTGAYNATGTWVVNTAHTVSMIFTFSDGVGGGGGTVSHLGLLMGVGQ